MILEPWRAFEVADPGIHRPEEKISIVPIRMVDEKLIYEEEGVPNVSLHAAKAINEGIDDPELVKKMIGILSLNPFDTKCTDTFWKILHTHLFFTKQFHFFT